MKFKDYTQFRESNNLTQASGQNLSNAPSAVAQTVDYNPGRTRSSYNNFNPMPPKGSPAGRPHSDPQIEQARVELGKLGQQARTILDQIKKTQYWEYYPQFQKSFLEKMRKAVDGITEAQTILSADSSMGQENI